MMIRTIKIAAGLIAGYVVLALLLGGVIAYVQPEREGTLILRTYDQSGSTQETVLREILGENGERYLWSAKWFRSWCYRALENPAVEIVVAGKETRWKAREVQDKETINRVVDSQRVGVSPALWWFGRSTLLFAPIKIISLEKVQ